MDVLLTMSASLSWPAFAVAITPYTNTIGTFDNTTAIAIMKYTQQSAGVLWSGTSCGPAPMLPLYSDTGVVANFSAKFQSLTSVQYLALVPRTVDRKFFVVGLNADTEDQTCHGEWGSGSGGGEAQGTRNGIRLCERTMTWLPTKL